MTDTPFAPKTARTDPIDCGDCGTTVMPIDERPGRYKCPACGWVDADEDDDPPDDTDGGAAAVAESSEFTADGWATTTSIYDPRSNYNAGPLPHATDGPLRPRVASAVARAIDHVRTVTDRYVIASRPRGAPVDGGRR